MTSRGKNPFLSPADREGLEWLQARVADLLAELRRISDASGFRYYLAYGTAIGALREHDLIAWDPDADVLIPRDDYAKALDSLESELAPDFELLRPGQEGYENLFARLAMRGVDHKIIRVDLFQLCPAPRTRIGRTLFTTAQRTLSRGYMLKRVELERKTHYKIVKRTVAVAIRLLLAPVPAGFLERVFSRMADRRVSREGGLLTNPSGAYGRREYFRASWFDGQITGRIREVDHPVPVGADPWLRQLYGDYLTPVPPDEVASAFAFAAEHYVRPLRELGLLESQVRAGAPPKRAVT